nr:hypothetical protein [Methylocystis sp. Sn-Cys]
MVFERQRESVRRARRLRLEKLMQCEITWKVVSGRIPVDKDLLPLGVVEQTIACDCAIRISADFVRQRFEIAGEAFDYRSVEDLRSILEGEKELVAEPGAHNFQIEKFNAVEQFYGSGLARSKRDGGPCFSERQRRVLGRKIGVRFLKDEPGLVDWQISAVALGLQALDDDGEWHELMLKYLPHFHTGAPQHVREAIAAVEREANWNRVDAVADQPRGTAVESAACRRPDDQIRLTGQAMQQYEIDRSEQRMQARAVLSRKRFEAPSRPGIETKRNRSAAIVRRALRGFALRQRKNRQRSLEALRPEGPVRLRGS